MLINGYYINCSKIIDAAAATDVLVTNNLITGTAVAGLPEILVHTSMFREYRWHTKEYSRAQAPINQ